MLKRTLAATACLAVTCLAGDGLRAQKKPTSTLVNAVFRCNATTAGCVTLDAIQGDGAPYTQASGGAVLNSGGDFVLNLGSSPGPRYLRLDFGTPDGDAPCLTSGPACRRTFGQLVSSHTRDVLVNPELNGVELSNGLLDIPVGVTRGGRLKVNFDDPAGQNVLWTVRFNPEFPGSTLVPVTRQDANTWVIEATTEHRARLVSADMNTRKWVTADEGLFVMPFRIVVTR
jgi:hypothetical protein